MKLREFNRLCRMHFVNHEELDDAQKQKMLLYIVRNRGAVHKSLVTPLLDRSWLSCMGYLYEDSEFILTGAQALEREEIKLKKSCPHCNQLYKKEFKFNPWPDNDSGGYRQ